MAKKRRKVSAPEGVLEMTPMIDVCFQLLIYFVVTIHPVDVVTNLDVFRPAPDPNAPPSEKPPQMIRVGVLKDGYTLNDRVTSTDGLERSFAQFAAVDASQTIMFTVSAYSTHGQLVKVLNLCAKYGLKSLSIVSASN
jgi:biopolymer transport protein ExbD